MSTYYYIVCDECEECLHISQEPGRIIYGSDEKRRLLGLFLKKHEDHQLCYCDEHDIKYCDPSYKSFRGD